MDTISGLTYYIQLFLTYATYYGEHLAERYREYPYEVQIAIWVILWALSMIMILTILLEYRGFQRKHMERLQQRLEHRFGEAIDFIYSIEDERQLTRDDLTRHFHLEDFDVTKSGLLRNDVERRMVCRMIYNRLLHDDVAGPSRQKNLHMLLDIFGLPTFLENEVSLANMRNKVTAMLMIRTFKLYINPWLLNKLMNSRQTRVRRLAMYLSVMSSSDSELDYFETDFFDNNCCIYDEIELGYTLHRRRAAGLKLPNLAHWARLQKNDSTKCMFVRLMRRFDQREYCSQLEDLFHESKHKKLIEEISRTWGYLYYTGGEQLLVDTMLTQPDDTKVAIMHAVTRMASGKSLELLVDGYRNTTNPHVRFEALRCMWSYGTEGRVMLEDLERIAPEADRKFFAFFHNPITLDRIPLDKEQAYHPSVETVYNMSEVVYNMPS